jgi:hypothetical protein
MGTLFRERWSAERWPRALLACGILASVVYVAMTLFVGLLWDGYSIVSGVPSELSAIDAPTRPLWMWLGGVYAILMVGFGWIVWRSAPPNRALRVVGALLMAHTVFGQFWPPMHQRAVLAAGGGTLTDTLHLVWAAITGVFFMFIVGFGAAALGKRFRVYSIATIVIVLVCGAVTGTYASQVQAACPRQGSASGSASASPRSWRGSSYWRRRSCALPRGWPLKLRRPPALDRLREVDNRRLVAIEDHTQEARSGLADSVEILPELVPAHLEQFRQRVGAGKRRAC